MKPTARPRSVGVPLVLIGGLLVAHAGILSPAALSAPARPIAEDPAAPTAVIEFRRASPPIAPDPNRAPAGADPYLNAQASALRSRRVLLLAAKAPEAAAIPLLDEADDPAEFLSDRLDIRVRPGSSTIALSSRGLEPREGAILVNAVARVYLDEVVERQRRLRTERLEEMLKLHRQHEEQIRARQAELDAIPKPPAPAPDAAAAGRAVLEAELEDCLRMLRRIRLERAALDARAEASGRDGRGDGAGPSALDIERKSAERREALLAEERGRLLASLAGTEQADAPRQALVRELQQLRVMAAVLGDEIEDVRTKLAEPLAVEVIRWAEP